MGTPPAIPGPTASVARLPPARSLSSLSSADPASAIMRSPSPQHHARQMAGDWRVHSERPASRYAMAWSISEARPASGRRDDARRVRPWRRPGAECPWRTGRASPRAAWGPTGQARPAPVARLAVQRTYARTAPRTRRARWYRGQVRWLRLVRPDHQRIEVVLDHHVFFGREVPEEGGLGDISGFDDLLDGGGVVTLLAESRSAWVWIAARVCAFLRSRRLGLAWSVFADMRGSSHGWLGSLSG